MPERLAHGTNSISHCPGNIHWPREQVWSWRERFDRQIDTRNALPFVETCLTLLDVHGHNRNVTIGAIDKNLNGQVFLDPVFRSSLELRHAYQKSSQFHDPDLFPTGC